MQSFPRVRGGATLPALGLALVVAGCASGPEPVPGGGSVSAPPPLDGAALLERTCTACHGLEGVRARAPYWGEPEWAAMVDTMIGYGAVLSAEELPVLVKYLGEEF